jgi:hypothetical protein
MVRLLSRYTHNVQKSLVQTVRYWRELDADPEADTAKHRLYVSTTPGQVCESLGLSDDRFTKHRNKFMYYFPYILRATNDPAHSEHYTRLGNRF